MVMAMLVEIMLLNVGAKLHTRGAAAIGEQFRAADLAVDPQN